MSDGGFTVDTDNGAICGSVGGDGPELVLLHGGPGLSDYTELLDGETSDWRTVRYQQRGLAPSSIAALTSAQIRSSATRRASPAG